MSQKTAFITGCSPGGIGDALARELHGRGFLVFATARSTAKLEGLRAMGMETMQLDVTSDESLAQAATALAAHPAVAARGLDLLVNNAGVDYVMPLADMSLRAMRQALDANLYGALAGTRVLLDQLVRAGGTVVMLGSITPFLGGTPFQVTYVATKAAIAAASDTMRVELRPLGVRVVLLVPGSIQTNLFKDHMGGGEGEGGGIKVPENSWYAPIRDVIEKRGFLNGVRWTPVDVFAKNVVDKLLKKSPPIRIWSGSLSSIVWWIKGFIWTGSMVSALSSPSFFSRLSCCCALADAWNLATRIGYTSAP
jgi:1-acylglycerone phosphate reductase